jgi:Pseudouridylate synthases, 23S RNA-specific
MNRIRNFLIAPEWDGMTVKSYVRRVLGFSARVLVQQRYQEGGILRNGVPCRTIDPLYAGDTLSFLLPLEDPAYLAVPGTLNILYEDENFLAVNKPSAMPVHPSGTHVRDSLLNVVAYYYQSKGEAHFFRPLYRLDRDTSGVVWIAKNRMAASSATLTKNYYGVCHGILKGSGILNRPIGLKADSKIVREAGHGESAVTKYQVIGQEAGYTLVRFQLETGRTHQIRVHLSDFGYPLAGDDLYGGTLTRIQRQALHCMETTLRCKAFQLEQVCNGSVPTDLRQSFPALFELLS